MDHSDKIEPGALRRRVVRLIQENRRLKHNALADVRRVSEWRAMFDQLPEGVVIVSADWKIMYQNQALLSMLRLSEDGMQRGEYWERQFLHPDGRTFERDELPGAVALQQKTTVSNVELGIACGDSLIWTSVTAKWIPEIGCAILFARDITHAKTLQARLALAEQSARACEARYRNILERLPVPLALHDSDGRIFFLNRAFTSLFGYTLEDIPTLAEWYPRAYPNPSYRKRVLDMRDARTEAWSAGRPFEPVDLKVCCKDGSFRTVRVDAGPLEEKFSEASHFITLYDLTEREKSLKKIRELEGALQEHLVLAVTNASGVILEVNEKFCQLSKYRREELIGRTHRVVNSGYHPPEFFRSLWSTIQSGSVWKGILRNRARDGTLYWLETTIVPVFGEDGQPESYIALRTDITDLVRSRDMAERASHAKTEFLAMMSHELRTPLNGIMGVLSLLREGADNPAQLERIEIAQRSSEILLGLISNLLDHVRLEAGKAVQREETVDIRGLLGHLLAIVKAGIHSRLDFQLEVAESVPALLCADKGKLSQVLLNLLGNAAKFTHEGFVRVSASVLRGENLILEITDTGIGFDESDLPKMFEPYSQLSPGSRYGGAGLGLSISHQLVHIMGGRITARSRKNAGSTFTVSLPLKEPSVQHGNVEPVFAHAAKTGTVLIAEDNELNLRILSQMLEVLGCKVRSARNGLEAVESVKSGVCDLILMDIQMPEMDGVEAALQIRKIADLPRIPIVALTADAWDERMQACFDAGMDGFITKPVTLEQLRGILDAHLPVS